VPHGQAAVIVVQLQRADAGMVVVAQGEAGPQAPLAPLPAAGFAHQQAAIREQDGAAREMQRGVEVNLQAGQDVFVGF
jgi:hypothetical protein